MQLSSRKLNKNIEKQIFSILYQLMADLKSPQQVETLLSDVLSGAERLAVAKRIAIATFLEKGRSYENIKETLKVSSATIASVQESMGNPGFQLALQRIKAEEWADEWSEKITGLFKSLTKWLLCWYNAPNEHTTSFRHDDGNDERLKKRKEAMGK